MNHGRNLVSCGHPAVDAQPYNDPDGFADFGILLVQCRSCSLSYKSVARNREPKPGSIAKRPKQKREPK
jgi:hypothetical protein